MTTPLRFVAESHPTTWDPQTSWDRVTAPRAVKQQQERRAG